MSIWQDARGRYHVGVMVDGQRVHRTLAPDASARDAKQLEAQLVAALGARRAPVIPGNPALADVMGAYMRHCDNLRSPATARHHALRIAAWVDGKRASDARTVASAIRRDMAGHYAAATINRSLGALKKALQIAFDTGLTSTNCAEHVKRLPEHNARDTHLSLADVQRIADHASPAVRAAIWIALYTGCRRGEVLAMQPADVQDDATRLLIHAGNTKTLKTRIIPITAPLRPWLVHLPLPINAEGLKSGFRRAREAAGMQHVHFHDLRHSCATILLAAGADLYTVAKVLGHSTIRMTERYAHHQIDAQRLALEQAFDSRQAGNGKAVGSAPAEAKAAPAESSNLIELSGRLVVVRDANEQRAHARAVATERKVKAARIHAKVRKERVRRQIPQWANIDAIRSLYELAQQLTDNTGVAHVVDHIIPLRGKLVSGLHVETNLQILRHVENATKSNKWEG